MTKSRTFFSFPPFLCQISMCGWSFFSYFVWDVDHGGPLLLIAGGSWIVPLMAILRHRAMTLAQRSERQALPSRLLYTSRRWSDVIYREALSGMATQMTHSRSRTPLRAKRLAIGRYIDGASTCAMLAEVAWPHWPATPHLHLWTDAARRVSRR